MFSTVASIQNVRKQRQLELELVELDRKWHVELKIIARERLGLLKEMCRINKEMRRLDHFNDTIHGKDLTRFADRAQHRQQHERESKLLRKYNFEPDPVEKVNVGSLPVIREPHDGSVDCDSNGEWGGSGGYSSSGGEDVGKVWTSKDLTKQRVQLQKINSEKDTADRRNKRRAFWDKSIIGRKKKDMNRQRNRPFGMGGFFRSQQVPEAGQETVQHAPDQEEEEPRKPRSPYKYPSLPSLNNLQKINTVRVNVHPSLSKQHSASLDYLPVIRGTQPNHGLFTSSKAAVSSGSTLPTIAEA